MNKALLTVSSFFSCDDCCYYFYENNAWYFINSDDDIPTAAVPWVLEDLNNILNDFKKTSLLEKLNE